MSGYYTIQRLPQSTTQIPYSTAILQDMVVSSRDLDQMERNLDAYEKTHQCIETIQDIPSKLEHVVKVYNENITMINLECHNFQREFKFFKYPTFAYYCIATSESETNTKALEEYENLKAIEKQDHNNDYNEICQLANIGFLHNSLKLKIETVQQRSMAYNLSVKELPQLVALWPKVSGYVVFVPTLRKPHEGANKLNSRETSSSSSSTTTTTSTTNTTPSTLTKATVSSSETVTPAQQPEAAPSVAVSTDPAPDLVDTLAAALKDRLNIQQPGEAQKTEEPDLVDTLAAALKDRLNIQQPGEAQKTEEVAPPEPAPAPTSVGAFIYMNLDLYNGTSIGICHEPNWGAKPVAFVRGTTYKAWEGQIPIGKEYKFVIVDSNGTVIKWENLPFNRRVETGTTSIQFPHNDADFS